MLATVVGSEPPASTQAPAAVAERCADVRPLLRATMVPVMDQHPNTSCGGAFAVVQSGACGIRAGERAAVVVCGANTDPADLSGDPAREASG